MITNIQALSREVEFHLNTDTQLLSILRNWKQTGTPTSIHGNKIYTKVRVEVDRVGWAGVEDTDYSHMRLG